MAHWLGSAPGCSTSFGWQALGTDPGLGEAPTCFTFLSAPIGAIVGLIVLVATGVTALPAAVGAAFAGAVAGWVSVRILGAGGTPSTTLPIRRYRHHAEEDRAGLRHGGAAGRGTRSDHFGGYELRGRLKHGVAHPRAGLLVRAPHRRAMLSRCCGPSPSAWRCRSWPLHARWSSRRRCQLARRRSRPKYETRQGSRRRSPS